MIPKCKCGCGKYVTHSKVKPYGWNEFIHGHNARVPERTGGQFPKGKISGSYKGGKAICSGYSFILQKTPERKYLSEHRLIMEELLNRKLSPDEIVHHINGNTLDNRPENLMVMSRAEHIGVHRAGLYVNRPSRTGQETSDFGRVTVEVEIEREG